MNIDKELIAKALELADELIEKGELNAAIDELNFQLARGVSHPALWLKLAHLYSETGLLFRSLEIFKKISAEKPKNELVSLSLFNMLWTLNLRKEAIEEICRFQSIKSCKEYEDILAEMTAKGLIDENCNYRPENDYAGFIPGISIPRPNRRVRGIVEVVESRLRVERLLAQYQGEPDGRPGASLVRRAARLDDAGERSEAIDLLIENFIPTGKDPSLCAKLGYFYWQDGGLARATALFRHATAAEPSYRLFSLGFFHVLWLQDRRDEALEELRRYLKVADCEEYSTIVAALQSNQLLDQDLQYLARNDDQYFSLSAVH